MHPGGERSRTILGLLTPLEGSVTLSGGVRANEIGYLP